MARRKPMEVEMEVTDTGLMVSMIEVTFSALESGDAATGGVSIIKDGVKKVVDIETGEEVKLSDLLLSEIADITKAYTATFFPKTN